MWDQDGGYGESHFNFTSITAAARRKAVLLHCAGMEVQEIFETLTDPCAPEGEDDDVYKAALRTLDAYCTPQVNVPYERHIFLHM